MPGDDRRKRSPADRLRRAECARGAEGGRRHGGRRAARAASPSSARKSAAWNRTACCARRASSASARSMTGSWNCPHRSPLDRRCAQGARSRRYRARGERHAEPRRLHERFRDRARLRRRAGAPLSQGTRCSPCRPRTTAVFPVRIESAGGCPVFGSRVIRGVRPDATSPAWLRERLRRVGLASISPIVDVTNYVMMDLGQPLHAYDLARLSQGITVRAGAARRAHHAAQRPGVSARPRISGDRGRERRHWPRGHHGRARAPRSATARPMCCSRPRTSRPPRSPAGHGAWVF